MLLYFSFFVKARSKYFRIVKYIDKVNKVECQQTPHLPEGLCSGHGH